VAKTKKDYSDKRSFDQTPEPSPETSGNVDLAKARPGPSFMIHQHHATRLHFDLRLEFLNGKTPVLVSFAVPKNLPLTKGKPHLAIHVEDHPFDYGTFSGTIPKGNYGAGEVRIFDSGTYELLEQEEGKLTIKLDGERFKGTWHMVHTKGKGRGSDEWLTFLRDDDRPEREELPTPAPMMATLIKDAFDDDGFIFEPKWDGVRALAVCSDSTKLFSRNLRDISATYPELGKMHERLVAFEALLDGEIVAMEGGRPSFERLQSRINLQNVHDIERASKTIPTCFIAFDLLYLDGRSLINEPVEKRKELLDELVVPGGPAQISTYLRGDGIALADAARGQKLEGIVAKKIGSPYRPGKRTKDWLKVKVIHEADVVVGGWTPGEGTRSSSFGALLVGAFDGDRLHFFGAVGTGFSDALLQELMPRLQAVQTDVCPFTEDPTGKGSGTFGKPVRDPRWLEPSLVAKVEYRELTSARRFRAPSFKGLRSDKSPEECTLDDVIAGQE
jgi:bifunctional non-homologous end joining protein LigD